MENIISFVLIIVSLIINIFAAIISSYILVYLIRHVWHLRDLNSLLVINTYLPVLFASIGHIGFNIQTILNETSSITSTDSTICHVGGYIYLYMIMWLFGSFSVQAYIRMLNILNPNRTYLRSFMATMIFIMLTWFGTFLLLLPTIFLNVIVYETSEYICVVDFHTWKGNLYMILSVYSIPITITATAYLRVIEFIKESSLRNRRSQHTTMVRDARVLQRMVILVCTLIVLGLPSAILWIQSLITGHLDPITYRIQAIFIAITMLILAIAVALTNQQVKRLLPLFKEHNTIQVMLIQPQQQAIFTTAK